MMPAPPPAPRWFAAVAIICLLPVFQFPWLLAMCPADSSVRTMIWIYPFYAAVAAYLAWQCYPRRHALAWILIALMILTHVSVWILATTPITQ